MTVVTKANILKKTDGKFTAICHEVAADYPEITVDDYYIDIMAANLVNERVRGGFQVLLLPNLYGDIITDEAAQLQGGVGTAGSANIGDRHAIFDLIHGGIRLLIGAAAVFKADVLAIAQHGGVELGCHVQREGIDQAVHIPGGLAVFFKELAHQHFLGADVGLAADDGAAEFLADVFQVVLSRTFNVNVFLHFYFPLLLRITG